MPQEEKDYAYFRENQLTHVNFSTGQLDVQTRTNSAGVMKQISDVGSSNQDGYVRVRCNRKLRMKHRLLFWLYHGILPKEVDHENGVRSDNRIANLAPSYRQHNLAGRKPRKPFKQLTEPEVRSLCSDIAVGDTNITGLGKKYGRSRAQIKGIMSKKYWSKISDQYF